MNVDNRLSKIENNLKRSAGTIVRITGCHGDYPERQEDIDKKRNVIMVMSPGISCEEMRKWAE